MRGIKIDDNFDQQVNCIDKKSCLGTMKCCSTTSSGSLTEVYDRCVSTYNQTNASLTNKNKDYVSRLSSISPLFSQYDTNVKNQLKG